MPSICPNHTRVIPQRRWPFEAQRHQIDCLWIRSTFCVRRHLADTTVWLVTVRVLAVFKILKLLYDSVSDTVNHVFAELSKLFIYRFEQNALATCPTNLLKGTSASVSGFYSSLAMMTSSSFSPSIPFILGTILHWKGRGCLSIRSTHKNTRTRNMHHLHARPTRKLGL